MKRPRSRLAVDLDDVVADFSGAWCEWSNRWFNTHWTREHYQEDWLQMWPDIDEAELGRRVDLIKSDPAFYPELKILPHAHAVLQELAKDYDLFVLTSRWTDLIPLTEHWLRGSLPDIFPVVHSSLCLEDTHHATKTTKGQRAKALKADFLIDDQLRHC